MKEQGRNTKCQCGSGRKFKRCCGDNAALSKQRQDEHAAWVAEIQERARQRERETVEGIRRGRLPQSAILAATALIAASIRR